MKPNQRGRFNGRHNNSSRGARPQMIFRNTSLESSGPCGKLRGTALQLHEKYMIAAKDAQIQNDDILAETCRQYADHYMHVQNQAILNEQALHAQHQANRQTIVTEDESIEAEITEQENKTELELKTDGELKVVDLSVPVTELNQKSEFNKKDTERKQPTLHPRGMKSASKKVVKNPEE